ncbi:DUF983 domain-containing protein [Phaeobacter sp. 11ANDIMAR09]|uniref:DUF983 domain-containing protein n=1 Tax=Phaeobacter sp. 11ANDIMAR09 TaxID=1225647 RepID=UPI0006C8A965|nr:DUF983 domain-containing protein [Phaeobacter sp. 11ANDIMAR09]KPD12805.1 hypothetical protein AN476_09445 [Phaeobacter sp. 11ANDIMAR09]OIQ34017.1 MAG: hypothetical protein BM559_08350 [Roseobacter sp. MedPE-SWchi]
MTEMTQDNSTATPSADQAQDLVAQPDQEEMRPWKPAVLRGLRLRCPNCGEGKILQGYLKVRHSCDCCGQELYHNRADDGPAYLTILIVGHLLGFALHITYLQFRPDPLTLALIMSAVTISSSLFLLPRMKGLVVAYQWAKRMHGF